jgi:hypothetical protein
VWTEPWGKILSGNEDDQLIGVVEVASDTLQDKELRVYIEALAKECDRFEYALRGWDRE